MARIFVVDDSREVRFLLRTVLQMEGHRIARVKIENVKEVISS